MRDLKANEFEAVAGGPGPVVYLAGAAIMAAGSAIGGYIAGRNAATAQASATMNTREGTVQLSCSAQ